MASWIGHNIGIEIIGGESGQLLLRLLGDELADNHHYFSVDGEPV